MAEPYLERLSQILARLEPVSDENLTLETKHFFNGSALYVNGKICATLSPAGFALKLPSEVRSTLIDEGKGQEFRFFPKGPIKREYVALSDSILQDEDMLREIIYLSTSYAAGMLGSSAYDEK